LLLHPCSSFVRFCSAAACLSSLSFNLFYFYWAGVGIDVPARRICAVARAARRRPQLFYGHLTKRRCPFGPPIELVLALAHPPILQSVLGVRREVWTSPCSWSRARRLFRSTPSANPIVYRWLAGGECTAGADRRVHATRLVCLPDTFCELCTIVPQYDGCGTYRPRCLVDVPHLLSSLTRDAFTNLGNSVFSLPSSSSHLRCSSSYLFLFLCFRNITSPWAFAFGPECLPGCAPEYLKAHLVVRSATERWVAHAEHFPNAPPRLCTGLHLPNGAGVETTRRRD
jgi:hypothetical protein